jgi:hypothetical protein
MKSSKLFRKKTSVFICLSLLLIIITPTSAAWVWIGHSSANFHSGMKVNSWTSSSGSGTTQDMNCNTYNNFQTRVISGTSTWSSSRAQAYCLYDSGKDDLGGSDLTIENTLYRAKVVMKLAGFITYNSHSDTFLKFTFTLYYMSGSSKYVVGTHSVNINSNQQYNNQLITHIVTSSSSVPSQKTLYVEVEVHLSAANAWGSSSKGEVSFFGGSNKIEYESFTPLIF